MAVYDIVIIGSGLGGLVCAQVLSKEGYHVCVLEKNRQIGGNLQIFSRDKCIFDTGVHYIGGLGEGQNLYSFFKYCEILDKLKLKKLDEDGFDIITFDGDPEEYPVAMGYDRFQERMFEKFPGEREVIKKYSQSLQEICSQFPLYNVMTGGVPSEGEKYRWIGARDFIESLTDNPKLRAVLAGNNLLYSGESDFTPLHLHALVVNSYINGAWRCIDGGGQIAKYLAQNIKANGGDIFNYTEVKRLESSGGKIVYAETTDGRRIEGKQFISNVHPAFTLNMLDGSAIRKSYRTRITSLRNSPSAFLVHLVFKPESFPYLNRNYYHNHSLDVWDQMHYSVGDWPKGFFFATAAGSRTETFAESGTVMAYMDVGDMERWKETFHTIPKHDHGRGNDYEEFKQQKAEKLIGALEKRFPGIKNSIRSYYTTSPLSYRDYLSTLDGSMYGIMDDYKNPLGSHVSPRTKIPNLFFTGQNIHIHGVLGVTVGALLTCGEFVGKDYLVERIRQAQ